MDKKAFNKKDLKLSIILMIVAAIAGYLITLSQIGSTAEEQLNGLPRSVFIIISTIQVSLLYGFILSFIGLKLYRATFDPKGYLAYYYAKQTDKNIKYHLDKSAIFISIAFGLINAILITFTEKFIFYNLIPELSNTTITFRPLYFISALLYGGIVEEIMLRLFFVSLIVYVLSKVFVRNKRIDKPSNSIYYIAIILAALLFGLGHLPAASLTFAITPIVVIRIVLLNAIAGVLFGLLYWKKGLEYAILSHMFSHIFMQLVFTPILF